MPRAAGWPPCPRHGAPRRHALAHRTRADPEHRLAWARRSFAARQFCGYHHRLLAQHPVGGAVIGRFYDTVGGLSAHPEDREPCSPARCWPPHRERRRGTARIPLQSVEGDFVVFPKTASFRVFQLPDVPTRRTGPSALPQPCLGTISRLLTSGQRGFDMRFGTAYQAGKGRSLPARDRYPITARKNPRPRCRCRVGRG